MLRCLLVLLLAWPALAEGFIVSFRLHRDPHTVLRGWARAPREDHFRFEHLGGGRRVEIPWDALMADDRTRLRRRFKLDLSEDERLGLVPGHKLRFRGGGSIDGVLVRVDDDGKHWLKREGFLLPYPGDRIEKVEEIRVKATDIFDEDELYYQQMQRTPPRTATQHLQLARYLDDLGHLEKATSHYRAAMRLRPALRTQISTRLEEIDAIVADHEAYEVLKRAKSAFRLRKDFDGGRAQIERFMETHPGRRRMALQLLDELESLRVEEMRKRFTAVKNEEFARAIDDFLRTRPELDDALSWVRAKLADAVVARVGKRMGLESKAVGAFLEEEPRGSPHFASYGNGSFIFSKRALKGKTTRKAIRGDPDRWWNQYGDLATRGAFLRAYAAERLPELFEIVQVKMRECGKCGGTGQVRHVSVRQLQDGRHEWKQPCPRCFKACLERSVAYR